MSSYYISPNGSDSNNGLGPDASHASNKPWLTLGKALGASGIASGDTVYIAPGTYRATTTVAMTSATAETFVLGDPTNAQAFKDGSGVLLAPGDVTLTAFTTNDWTTPSTSSTINLSARDFLTFQYLTIIGGNGTGGCILAQSGTSTDIKFRDCAFLGCVQGQTLIEYFNAANIATNWLIDRCLFFGGSRSVSTQHATSTTADYDVNFVIQNSLMIGWYLNAVNIGSSGANSFKGGGVDIINCTMIGGGVCVNANATLSTTFPSTVYNCFILSGNNAPLFASTSGYIVADYNDIYTTTANGSVTNGSNTKVAPNYAPLVDIGQSYLFGRAPRPFFTPLPGSPLLGFGNQASPGGNTQPTVDLLNRPRPSGGGVATTTASTTGTATAGAASTLTDGGASWTTNAFAGYKVKLTGGTGSGQERLISSNTGTVLTISPAWGTNPDNTSTYSIYQPGVDYAVGYLERHDTAAQETSTTQAGSSAIKIIGPGDQDFQIPVDASATVISVYARYDSNHATTNKPQVILLANSEIGVSTETKTMTSAADTWEQLTFSSFTPTRKGIVTIRCVSRAAAGQGVAYFDTVAVS